MGYPVQQQGMVCKLHKSLYGLRQASRQWFLKFSTELKSLGFQQATSDYSLFSRGKGTSLVILLVYVDDIIVAGPNLEMINQVRTLLQQSFKLKVIGDLKYFLGLEIARASSGIFLSQRKYTLQLLSDTGFMGAKPQSLPLDLNIKLTDTEGTLLPDSSMYRRLIGRLLYLTISRPDITFAVNKLSQFMAQPRTCHLDAVHHLLQYLKGAPGQGIFFSAKSNLQLSAFTDADWGSCLVTRRSTTGLCIFMGDALICWKSKKQPTVSRSSAEAEYRALAYAASELLWLKQLFRVFEIPVESVKVFSDNKSAMHLATNPLSHDRSKHVDIDVHFIREHVHSGFLRLIHVRSEHQLADPLTKAIPLPRFKQILSKLGVKDIYLPT